MHAANEAVSRILKSIFGGGAPNNNRVHTIEEQRLDTLGDDFDESSEFSSRRVIVPSTPGAS